VHHDITLRRVHITALAMESKKYYIFLCVCVCVCVCVCECVYVRARASAYLCMRACGCGCTGSGMCLRECSVTYPVCHAQAPYSLRPVGLHRIFRHYLINGMTFGKNYWT
jgi:hypothetical protein